MSGRFDGRVALVGGGTGALGRAVALAFLGEGARVAVTYRRREEYDAVVSAAGAAASRLEGYTSDVTDETAVAALVQEIAGRHGRLDILVNAVGGYAGGKKLWEDSLKTYEQMMALNLKAGFVLARGALPAMIRQNRGWIVNVASRAGLVRSPGAAAYAASKAAALSLFDSLADEVKEYDIRVNSVVPSIFDTPANRQAMPSADFASWPKPEEIARVILFLCSEDARIVHGAAIPVYGRT